jgi:hypothetical protein
MIAGMRRAASRAVALLLLALVAGGLLASCDLPGHSTTNSYQRVANNIP